MFSSRDLEQLTERGVALDVVEEQLRSFVDGFPFLELDGSAGVARGILSLSDDDKRHYEMLWNDFLRRDKKVVKFVPASGAASRMFKNMFEFLSASYDIPTTDFEKKYFADIEKFAFFGALNEVCLKNEGKEALELIAEGNYKAVVANMLEEKGLNYGKLPKGLLQFHGYGDQVRTAMEEHLAEGANYAMSKGGKVNIHFTVSPEHLPLFKSLVMEKKEIFEAKYGVEYDITFSVQKLSTDTIAVDKENKIFREGDGSMLFRPGGHGALIENLNDIDGDVVFVKNIDNVVPDNFRGATIKGKKLLAGILVSIQKRIFDYIEILEAGCDIEKMAEIASFMENELFILRLDIKDKGCEELGNYLLSKLRRPLRVCGMVKNVGEPGGGPFFAVNSDGTVSLQILESSQIDFADEEKKNMFECGTHFNPVDLVCAVKDNKGVKYNLPEFVDKKTGFISEKSKGGRELRALELPGLWNGAMSNWNTIFVEVPIETFNPVKSVNDLLRSEHQN